MLIELLDLMTGLNRWLQVLYRALWRRPIQRQYRKHRMAVLSNSHYQDHRNLLLCPILSVRLDLAIRTEHHLVVVRQ